MIRVHCHSSSVQHHFFYVNSSLCLCVHAWPPEACSGALTNARRIYNRGSTANTCTSTKRGQLWWKHFSVYVCDRKTPDFEKGTEIWLNVIQTLSDTYCSLPVTYTESIRHTQTHRHTFTQYSYFRIGHPVAYQEQQDDMRWVCAWLASKKCWRQGWWYLEGCWWHRYPAGLSLHPLTPALFLTHTHTHTQFFSF